MDNMSIKQGSSMKLTDLTVMIPVTGLVTLSLFMQNFKGFIYLAFLIAISLLRFGFLKFFTKFYNKKESTQSTINIEDCDKLKFLGYGNANFTIFILVFSFTYIIIPMIYNKSFNWFIISLYLALIFLDGYLKSNCIENIPYLLHILTGAGLAILIVMLFYIGGSGKYLFFNEINSSKDVCYRPNTQTFKCSLYKDGTLITEL